MKSVLSDINSFKNFRHFDDLDIFCCLVTDFENVRESTKIYHKQIIKNTFAFVFNNNYHTPENLESVFLIIQKDEKAKLEVLQQFGDDFNINRQEYKNLFTIDISPKDKQLNEIRDIINELLGIFLVTGRPLIGFYSTFYLPLDINHSDNNGDFYSDQFLPIEKSRRPESYDFKYLQNLAANNVYQESLKANQQAYLYFNDDIRDHLFDLNATSSRSHIQPIEEYTLDCREENNLSWHLQVDDKDNLIAAQLHKVSLLKYYNGLYLFALEVQFSDELEDFVQQNLKSDDALWWFNLLNQDYAKLKQLQVCHWLKFNYYARNFYPFFHEQEMEDKFRPLSLIKKVRHPHENEQIKKRYEISKNEQGIKIGEEKNSIILYLISQFFNQSEQQISKRLCHVEDSRLFCNSAYALMGKPASSLIAKEQHKRLFSLMLYIDRAGMDTFDSLEHYAYDPDFIDQLMQQQTYKRWHGLGTTSGFTNFSNIYCGYGLFFKLPIASIHVPYIYGRMLVLSLFCKMTLKLHARNIANIEPIAWWKKLYQKIFMIQDKKSHSLVTQELLEFTNRYYFHEVTSQQQGQEIFSHQTQALRLDQERKFIQDEINWSDEYFDKKHQEQSDLIVFVLTLIVSIIAIKDIPDVIDNFTKYPTEYKWGAFVLASTILFFTFQKKIKLVIPLVCLIGLGLMMI